MAQNTVISVDQLATTLSDTLNNYNRDVLNNVKIESKKAMDQLVQKTKETAPVGHRHKHYKNSITSHKTLETQLSVEYEWYVKGADYRLSHLLEHGHATRNGGRTKAFHFIENATNTITDKYIQAIEEVLRNG